MKQFEILIKHLQKYQQLLDWYPPANSHVVETALFKALAQTNRELRALGEPTLGIFELDPIVELSGSQKFSISQKTSQNKI